MSTQLSSILINKEDVSQDDAAKIGVQTGITILGSIVESGAMRYVSKALGAMKGTKHYDTFVEALMKQLEVGSPMDTDGMRARARMAREMQEGSLAMRVQLHEIALSDGEKNLALLDSLLETGEIVDKTAKSLLEPIEGSIRQFVNMSQHGKMMAAVTANQESVHHKCGNPECENCAGKEEPVAH